MPQIVEAYGQRLEFPDGMQREQIAAAIKANELKLRSAAGLNPADDMGMLDRFRAGIGRGMVSAARGVGQLVGLVSDEDVAEAKRLDAALMGTTAGKVGNVVGLAGAAVPTALIPGANTYMGASLIGAGLGATTTEGDALERLKAAGFGAVGGVGGKYLGDKLGQGARWLADQAQTKFAAQQAAGAQRMTAAQAAAQSGYIIPPADLKPGMLTEALSGLSGKIKTAQVASQRNQATTNSLARQALGLADDAPLTADALAAVRANAGRSYDTVRGLGAIEADSQYGAALDALAQANRNVMPDFPGLARSDVPYFLEGLKKEAFDASTAVDAIRLLRSRADQAFRTGDNEMGRAAKAAAGELEGLIERNLAARDTAQTALSNATGKLPQPGPLPAATLKDFREARQLMAKTYSVEKALNAQTGDVSAQVLARELAKGKPLSGELRKIAEAGLAFPKATQALKEAPKAASPLDWAVGAMTGASTGNPLMLGLTAVRPAARELLLSPVFQRAALREAAGPGLLTQLPAGLLDHELARRAAPGMAGILAARGLLSVGE